MKKNTAKSFLKWFHIFLSLIILSAAIYIFVFTCLMKPKLSTYLPYLYDYSSKPVLFLLVGSALAVAVSFVGIISVWQEWIRGIVTLSCCGLKDFTDWAEFLDYIPGSCCQSPAFCDTSEVSKLHLAGCYTALKDIVEYSVTMIFVVLVGLAIIEICSIISSIFLVACLRRERKGENDNSARDSIQLPRVHNPLGQNATPSITITSPGGTADEPLEPVYVRRPIERPIIFAYRSPHEDYLHRPPQYRFDSRRISFTNNKQGKHTPHVYDSSRYS
ncbi:tetraspanin-7 isoform X2 [Diachasma alloeum]|uniref:tetraspanin-7 isoform X2 n=1 Tax=Diachasma alloeum TaxID=454923 RepID=UPI0007383A58|nr:tetraspanin-7 isoform X2 [Diachasma alloeum]